MNWMLGMPVVVCHLIWWPKSSVWVSSDNKSFFQLTPVIHVPSGKLYPRWHLRWLSLCSPPIKLLLVKHLANRCHSLSHLSLWRLELLKSCRLFIFICPPSLVSFLHAHSRTACSGQIYICAILIYFIIIDLTGLNIPVSAIKVIYTQSIMWLLKPIGWTSDDLGVFY